ncbi:MAG: signal peptide peptidase SppA [Bacteroidetes bacterium]|nr:signal peptide peptidase SppA [Bacteroidota bacterium]MDA1119107.1 signal peptide peptidase SppA [Bacteroidota bacterium]
MNFLKNVLAVITGLFVFSFIAFIGFFLVIAIIPASSNQTMVVSENSILRLNLSGEIHEKVPNDPFSEFLGESAPMLSVIDASIAIRQAASDDDIKGLYIRTGLLSSGYASLTELREAIQEFKSSGKFVLAYGEFYSEKAYYLASIADEIYIQPEGSIEFNGISANITFYQGAFEKLGVEPQIFRVGEFKGAVEPFIRKDLSPENRLQLETWLSSLNDVVIAEIAESRNLEVSTVREISNSMLVTSPASAKEHGLITDSFYADQVENRLKELADMEQDDDFNFVSTKDYYLNWSKNEPYASDRVAVVVAEGEILGGDGTNYTIGSKKFASTLKNLRNNSKVKALVLRINSPGGGMTASDVIWREISLIADSIPVIASMGDYAASGGYYLAAPCDTIVCQSTTLTGSIGVFGMLFNFGPFLTDKLGITHDVVRTGEYSDIFTVTRSLTDQEKEIIQHGVENSYETFIDKVSTGRKRDNNDIKAIASGKIWHGQTALENGLVDVIGGLKDAIKIAAEAADLEEYSVVYYPEQKSFFEEIISEFGGQVQAIIRNRELGILEPFAGILDKARNYQGTQARLPFEFELN